MSGDSDSQPAPAEHNRGMDRVPESAEDCDGDGEASADTADNNSELKVSLQQNTITGM